MRAHEIDWSENLFRQFVDSLSAAGAIFQAPYGLDHHNGPSVEVTGVELLGVFLRDHPEYAQDEVCRRRLERNTATRPGYYIDREGWDRVTARR